MSDWTNISSAPRDGSYFLSWNGEEVQSAFYGITESHKGFLIEACFVGENGCHMGSWSPWPELTHWMPIPTPPGESSNGE